MEFCFITKAEASEFCLRKLIQMLRKHKEHIKGDLYLTNMNDYWEKVELCKRGKIMIDDLLINCCKECEDYRFVHKDMTDDEFLFIWINVFNRSSTSKMYQY